MLSSEIDRQVYRRYGRTFRQLSEGPMWAALSKATGMSVVNLQNYWGRPRDRRDSIDIGVRLLEAVLRGQPWCQRVDLFVTASGGAQAQAMARVFELRSGLLQSGLSIACAVDMRARNRRIHSWYRLVFEDEVSRTKSGRISFYSITREHEQPAPKRDAQPPKFAESAQRSQDSLFE